MPTNYSGSLAEIRTLDTFIKLTRCTNSLLGRLAERNTIGDLTWSQFAVLEWALHHLGPLTQGEVSAKVLKSGSNITTVIDNLERDGLVCRERDIEDRRVIHVHLTEAGTGKIEAVLPGHVAAGEEFGVLSAEEQETLHQPQKTGARKEGQMSVRGAQARINRGGHVVAGCDCAASPLRWCGICHRQTLDRPYSWRFFWSIFRFPEKCAMRSFWPASASPHHYSARNRLGQFLHPAGTLTWRRLSPCFVKALRSPSDRKQNQ